MAQTKKKKRSRSKSEHEDSDENTNTAPEISLNIRAAPTTLVPLENMADRRLMPRYPLELETVVFFAGISFRTKTLNISLTGILLAESIPAKFVGQELDIVMITRNGRIRDYFLVKGKALEEPLRSPRVIFTQIPKAQEQKLRDIIENLKQAG